MQAANVSASFRHGMTTENRGACSASGGAVTSSCPTFSSTVAPKSRRVVIVGSGPAGIACASALVERGLRPVVLDGGRRLDPERAAAVAASPAGGFAPELLAELRAAFPVDIHALPLKPVYGSTYPYESARVRASRFTAVPSHAVGGLSAVWGAAILPYGERDHAGWVFGRNELEPHYRAVLRYVPLAGAEDALAESFPLFGEPHPIAPTRQIASLLDDVQRHEPELRAAGVVAGRSRLAVWAGENPYGRGCERLGLCMLGCPNHSIWSSSQTLAALADAGLVEHRPGIVVERFDETTAGVRLHGRGPTGEPTDVVADLAFVAAGPLETTRIALASVEAYDREVALLDSAYFTFPAVRWPRGQRVEADADTGNTLAQVFVEIDDASISSWPVHLQLYGVNSLMLRALAARARLSEPVAARLLQPVLRRLVYVQGYLHSSESPGARVALGRDGMLSVEGGSGDGGAVVARVLARLRTLRRRLRLEPIAPMLELWPPGKGFHVGGSFPMCERPEGLESDVLGRLPGFRRVHLADASVFPTLPAQTITLAVMANAHRIASAAADGST